MTKISELIVGQGNVNVEGVIKEIGEKRSFNKFGRELSVVDAIFEDDSGSIRLSLWNENSDRFKQGDKVRIVNGYVNEFQGEKQLTAGKFGKIEKAGEEGPEEVVEEGEEPTRESESSEDSEEIEDSENVGDAENLEESEDEEKEE